ncbi:hypothetical protein A3G63_00740 [Candidatus Kaiserbacteria bacterium RIFCSPLOWO2_12_FULL_52_8]|uniref:Large ribosomal subunit protein uL15 n=1 Tax=Candidatus Kaiserbacteria bacterium RIFCSPHIGHO2_01_FULL_53_31 TaxID=1798481 RepID=A0A1F6CIM3_9BACT|nr:MAG: hypothetical protein A2678_00415 [Candidatus Kaiserbacteria bacterium RIFCSPHIGHO2_01_FULL_53_31]OGG94397.1 MAG: hypothetical protein A3G63_00740 [Candidatus Kaiserbacteria bacterium RIFCSPLOWO2_12_FULL_52_8]
MQLHQFSARTKRHTPEPVGRGGKRGKTSGRGGKGQTARAGHKIRPEVRDLIKKIPKLRGHGKNRARTVRRERIVYTSINLAMLEATYKDGEIVSPASLLAKGLVRRSKGRAPAVKILGVLPAGGFTKKLSVRNCVLSTSARAAFGIVGDTHNA